MKLEPGTAGNPAGPGTAWAKLDPRERPEHWHPLADHCHDVAACVAAILALPAVSSRVALLAGVDELAPAWRDRLVVLAFLHDLGKANHAFQERRGGHIAEAAPLLVEAGLAEAANLTALDPWFHNEEAAVHALAAVLAHHGAPPPSADGDCLKYAREWRPTPLRDPPALVRDLIAEARRHWPLAFAEIDTPALPQAPAFWHGLLGLVQLGDWLGSDAAPDAFPFSQEADPPRHLHAGKAASYLIGALGLDAAGLRRAMPDPQFDAISGGAFPARPIQAGVALAEGPVVVLESETGSGKTEPAWLLRPRGDRPPRRKTDPVDQTAPPPTRR